MDWVSVIEAVRVICKYEMRICNWCTRAAFHDAGSNTVIQAVGAKRRKGAAIVSDGGADGSLLLTVEQLRAENAYDRWAQPHPVGTVKLLYSSFSPCLPAETPSDVAGIQPTCTNLQSGQ